MFPTTVPMHRARMRPCVGPTWTALLLAFALCNRPAGASPAPAPDIAPTPASAAMRIERDPVTGTITPAGPSADRMLLPLWSQTMRPALDRLTPEALPDGSLRLDLTGIYLDFATAQLGWDGRATVDCDVWTPDVLRPLPVAPRPARTPLTWAEE